MDKTQRIQQWTDRIANFKCSGLTMSTWCTAQDLSIHKLKYWLRKINPNVKPSSRTPSVNWLPLTTSQPEPALPHATPLVVRVGHVGIEVHSDFDATLLRQIVRALEVPC
jgi:hypothetical protein